MIKYKYILLVVFLFLVFGISKVNANVLELPLLGKTIYIDPGHGGVDPGASYKDIYEEDVVLELSLVLKEELMKEGAVVLLTREGDYELANPGSYMRKRSDLINRAKLINEANTDIYISIHLNSYPSSKWQGAQAFYSNSNKNNKIIAEYIQESLRENTHTRRKIKEIKDQRMYDTATRPGILLEAAFISNPNDRYLIRQKEYQIKLSKAICKGIIEYYRNL